MIDEPATSGRPPAPTRTVQLWIEPISDDPEAISALGVARRTLDAGRRLRALRRARLIELRGALPEDAALEEVVHRSTQFYNPHKERCRLRSRLEDPPPLAADERAVLVFDRGGERRAAAERWWRHAVGRPAAVREGVAWVASAEEGADTQALIEELTVVRDRRRGLLCNPHAQEWRTGAAGVPLPWFSAPRRKRSRPAGRRS